MSTKRINRILSLVVIVALMLALMPITLAAASVASEAPLAPATTQTIGGTAASGNLRISVLDTGQMRVEKYVSGVWVNNWYGGTNVGSRVQFTGGAYTLGYFGSGTGTAVTLVSNTGGGAGTGTIVTTWTAGSLTIVQTTSYTDGNEYFAVTWAVTNNGGSTLNDLRFFHGGDTELYGSDQGQGWWRAADHSVGVTHPTNGQQMWLQGITAPAHYNSMSYSTVRNNGNNGLLTDIVDPTTHDNGMALQWNNATLAPSATWAIQMKEYIALPKPATTTTLVGLPDPSAPGQTVTFTATVTGSGGTPTGDVTFYDGSTLLGTGTLGSGQATYSTSLLSTGSHTITAIYGGDSTFGGSSAEIVVTVILSFELTVNTAGTGSGSVSTYANGTLVLPANRSFASGTVVTLTAVPSATSVFAEWSGAVTGTNSTVTVTMDADKVVTATFVANYVLTVNKAGAGSGSVIAAYGSGTVLLPGTAQLPAQITNIAPGTVITLTAVPSTTSVFTGWSGAINGATNPVTVTMDADKVVTATFDLSADLAVTENVLRTANAITYTIVARNLGPGASDGAVVSSTFPAEVSSVTWTCIGSGGAVCGGSGSGNSLANTLTTFPASGVVTYSVKGTLDLLATGNNMVTITPPAGVVDPNLANNQAMYKIYRFLIPVLLNNASFQ